MQGVGYRDALCREAERRGVTGWVRNRTDGSVEALVQGDAERRGGAHHLGARAARPAARVDEVHIEPADASDVPARFERRPSA